MQSILTINGGSSSIKFTLYQVDEPLKQTTWTLERALVFNETLDMQLFKAVNGARPKKWAQSAPRV